MEQQQETWKLPEGICGKNESNAGDACDTFLASYEKSGLWDSE